MDKEYLEDYEERELDEYQGLLRKIQTGEFSFEKDRYPSDDRFVNLQRPVARATFYGTLTAGDIWAQVPFSGSLILLLPPYPREIFERVLFRVSEIPEIIDFIKETGKLQVTLLAKRIRAYQGLDYLDPFFEDLKPPPVSWSTSIYAFGNKKEIQEAAGKFVILAEKRYFEWLRELTKESFMPFRVALNTQQNTYIFLSLGRYTVIEDIDNLMINDPEKAFSLLDICAKFICGPIFDLRSDLMNFTLEEFQESQILPVAYRPKEIRVQCEIGKFLLRKLTYAPSGLRACRDLLDHYEAYDLRDVVKALNDAIVANHPDIVNESVEELSEIIDNVWQDPTIPRGIQALKRGVPMSIAAIGTATSALTGGLEGFLAGLGFSVGAKFLDAEFERLSERIVKLFAKSYQANVYDFKKKYKHKITVS